METMIKINNLTFLYPEGMLIFDHFSWEVACQESWAVLGPSGCGKSTLLYLLDGLRLPTSGEITILGKSLTHPRPRTGLILQDYGLLPWATVRENIRLGLKIRKFYGPDGKHAPSNEMIPPADSQVDFWMERLGLKMVASKYPAQISGGQRQRTAIARTLVLSPDLLLMDEPFASLDAPTRSDLQKLVLELNAEQQITSVLVTHSIEEAALMGQKILVLNLPPTSKAFIIDNPEGGNPSLLNPMVNQEIYRQLKQALGETQ